MSDDEGEKQRKPKAAKLSSKNLPAMVAIDTSFIEHVHSRVPEAEKALGVLVEAGTFIYVPTPVWAECGRGPGGDGRLNHFLAASGMAPAPLNVAAAKMLAKHLGAKNKSNPCGRYVWNYDCQIYVCAIAAGCDGIVTDNAKDFESIASASAPPILNAITSKPIRIWTSAELARYARREQLKLKQV